jgi:hypothetical protein
MTAKQKPERVPREYPHSSGDRNAHKPTRDNPEPEHRGGTQRVPDPDPTGPDPSADRKPVGRAAPR